MRLKTVKVKTAKNRKLGSSLWLNRQLNDPYVFQSKQDGYRSRAAYKLIELNEKYRLIKPQTKVIDLGAAPGGWSQVVANILKSSGKIAAIDLLDMPEIQNVNFIQGDFCEPSTHETLKNILGDKADLILSDMAPNTTGHKATDHLRIMDLCERVFEFAKTALKEGGSVVIKIFQGGAEPEILNSIKKNFEIVKHHKPPASRKDSSEMYLVAIGYKGTKDE